MQASPVYEVRLAIRHREEQTSTLQPNARALQRDPARAEATLVPSVVVALLAMDLSVCVASR
jgi:hypothetical protein